MPGFQSGGVVSAPISAPVLPSINDKDLKEAIEALGVKFDKFAESTDRRFDRIKTIVVPEEVAASLDEADAIKTQATFE